ncbi:flavodoxin family protein [Paraburkholderia sp. HP33-1]|uniref:flavodoxin family protein n=1 Tax=Paraburkholderia sp. HP33-1 TaxID=2883243 RepID=UPI001F1955A6|nr:flavodoxin family protein [Paraburkholderia sp. HP33-1]
MLISIVYDSGYGHTARQAEAVSEGVRKVPGAAANLIAVADRPIPWDALEHSDAIIFGSPTYNGTLSAKLKQFFEDANGPAWNELKWRNKIAAGFTNSGAQNGDKLNTLMSMALFAAQHAMIWVGLDLKPGNSRSTSSPDELNQLGSWIGAMAQSNVDEGPEVAPRDSDLRTAARLGERVAEVARQFAPR